MTLNLTIIHHNVQNWNTNRITLSNIYNTINPDIILINEHSRINNETIKIFNYNTYTKNIHNERHAGTAIAIRKNLSIRLDDTYESDMIDITIETRQGPLTIATTYVPPRTNYLNFIDLNKLFSKPHPSYLFADLNAKHYTLGNTNSNKRGQHINYFLQQNKCHHIGPFFPTIIRHNSATNPDIVLKNNHAFHNIHFKPGPLTPSDHIPIITKISTNPIQIAIKPRRCFHKTDWDNYRQELENTDTDVAQHNTKTDIDRHLDSWTDAVKNATEKHIPTISYRTIPGIRPTQEIQILEIQHTDLMTEIQTNGPTADKYEQLRNLRTQIRDTYKRLHDETWTKLIEKLQNTNCPRQFHKSINRMMGNAQKTHAPYIKDRQGNRLDTPQEKETLFTQHCTTIFTEDDNNDDFDKDHIETIEQYMHNNRQLNTCYNNSDLTRLDNNDMPPITMDELTNTIKTFKQKAPGPTGITTIQIRQLPINMKQYLLDIFNHAISTGYFPDKIKHANFIFIPKPNKSPHQVENYRPISLLDVHGKILDKILNTRLNRHLNRHNILHPRQHGFRQQRGTDTALATFHETIAINMAQRHYTDIILRDVTKAFDKVWTIGLQYKISQLHLHDTFTKTLNNYLINRIATVSIENHIGPHFNLNSGVPQGACLSPTLYSLYTNDIPHPLLNTDYIAYADDITQITSGRYKQKDAARNTKHAIEQINTYENKWKIQTNTGKFTVIPLSRHKTTDITINNTPITYEKSGKILGLHFNKFGFAPQITARKHIALANLNKLYRFQDLPTQTKKKLYLTYIRPALIYPIIPLHTQPITQIRQLQTVQNKAIRFITNTRLIERKSSRQLHLQLKLPSINTILHTHANKIWDKIENNIPELYNQLKLPENSKQHNRFRSSKTIARQPAPIPIYS